jgi:hypothetical protein
MGWADKEQSQVSREKRGSAHVRNVPARFRRNGSEAMLVKQQCPHGNLSIEKVQDSCGGGTCLDQHAADYVRGIRAAAEFAGTHDGAFMSDYKLEDIILCKFNATSLRRPRKKKILLLPSPLAAVEIASERHRHAERMLERTIAAAFPPGSYVTWPHGQHLRTGTVTRVGGGRLCVRSSESGKESHVHAYRVTSVTPARRGRR